MHLCLTFGNVHGVYKPGNVKLRPELLGEMQAGSARAEHVVQATRQLRSSGHSLGT